MTLLKILIVGFIVIQAGRFLLDRMGGLPISHGLPGYVAAAVLLLSIIVSKLWSSRINYGPDPNKSYLPLTGNSSISESTITTRQETKQPPATEQREPPPVLVSGAYANVAVSMHPI